MLKGCSWPRDKNLFWETHCQKGAEERKETNFKAKSSLSHAMALQDEIEKSLFPMQQLYRMK